MSEFKRKTVREFLKGTRNHYIIEIGYSNDSNEFEGTYEELKKTRKDLLDEIVWSYDVLELADESLIIGIII